MEFELGKLVSELWPYLVPIGIALLMGKALRRVILLPFEWWARKSKTKVDDVLVSEAAKDLGLEKGTLDVTDETK